MFETEFSFSLVSEIVIILGLLSRQYKIIYHEEGSGSWASFLCYNEIE